MLKEEFSPYAPGDSMSDVEKEEFVKYCQDSSMINTLESLSLSLSLAFSLSLNATYIYIYIYMMHWYRNDA